MMRVESIRKAFGGLEVLREVGFEIATNSVTALIGQNGAGKSTLLHIITGLQRADEGTIHYKGEDISRLRAHRRAARGISRMYQHPELMNNMTIGENLAIGAKWGTRTHGRGSRPGGARKQCGSGRALSDLVQGSLAAAGAPTIDLRRRPSELPFIAQRQVELARALISQPSLLIMDEPAAGMTEPEWRALSEIIRGYREGSERSVLLVEHNIDFVMMTADKLVVLDAGSIIYAGQPHKAFQDPGVREAYLGTGNG